MDLVVPAGDGAQGREEEGAVEDMLSSPFDQVAGAAEEQVGA